MATAVADTGARARRSGLPGWMTGDHPLPWLLPMAALLVGFGLGMVIFALSTSSPLGEFIASIKAFFKANPALGIAITLGTTIVPMVIGLFESKD